MIFSNQERQAPTKVSEAEPSHLARYNFCLQFIKNTDRVLDLPGGSGYGSNLIATRAKNTVGIDICPEAILHAKEFFQKKNTEFLVADMENLKTCFPQDSKFDVIVSFEGIEHIKNQKFFLNEVRRLLKKDGYFIISTPRKPHGSPYHTTEFSLEDFKKILSEDFIVEKMFGQIYTDIFDMQKRLEDPHAYHRFNFIALCKHRPE